MKAILFDFGGTLDTDGIHWSELFWETYVHFHIPVTKENLREAFIYSERKIANVIKPEFSMKQTLEKQLLYQLEYLQDKHYLPSYYSFIIDELSEYCYRYVIKTVMRSKELLENLNSQYSLGIISNYYGNLETVLQELSIKKYFSSVIDSTKLKIRKPDKQIFKVALNDLAMVPQEVIMIGDSYENDIIPAKSIGCFTIWIQNKVWQEPVDNGSADFKIESITELPKVLENLN
ncbi:MAG TPA: HAD family hydrolase [Ignavibacteriaceae bacterium]|jgi:putative hydrolase of the HAD superfamily|nr:MAG: Pyrimidine 5'-nucleotidase YjjG [Ignavibacteria bacterium ADurb.Bin266]OQY74922.1 MAG: hypothetical protein B6D44_02595 [Ignavibacteriales bacterium UTCHB2]HQF42732.1 HAD family hydrolase [Ignavibacteriaceae bacterium]HQI39536.1 HAD family hydrolase [Ignavibacteriaceae bacterium]HQJ45132.1 HAD family hydrolase [Ignavibacteriaceae bacterium]